MQRRARRGASSCNISRILRNFGLYQNNVKHNFSPYCYSNGKRKKKQVFGIVFLCFLGIKANFGVHTASVRRCLVGENYESI
jgi:hypothetical protein